MGSHWERVGKPLVSQSVDTDKDVQFVAEVLNLPQNRLLPMILSLDEGTMQKRIRGEDQIDYPKALLNYQQVQGSDVVLLEGPENLEEGTLFDLSLVRVAEILDARVVLVARFHSLLIVGALISAKRRLGDRLLGALINDIPEDRFEEVKTTVKPYLEQRGFRFLDCCPEVIYSGASVLAIWQNNLRPKCFVAPIV